MNKSARISFILFIFAGLFFPLQAQQHAMNAMRMHMQAHNNHVRMHQQFMHMHQMNSMNMNVKKYSEKYKFRIINLEGDTITAKKKVKVEFFAPMRELKIKTASGDTIFTPEKTREVLAQFGKRYITGVPHDNSWVFKTFTAGDIEFYASYPEPDMKFLTYYKTPTDSLKPLTTENMATIMKGYEKAEKALEKNKQEKALKIFIKEAAKREKAMAKID